MRHHISLEIIFRLSILFTLFSQPLYAMAAILPPPEKISPHAWAWIGPYEGPDKQNQGYRMNLGFVVGNKSVAVIDSGYTEAMAEEMLQHIKNITPLPVRYVINTNSQPHRFMGNSVFSRQGATIIAAKDAIPRMSENAPLFAATIERILQYEKNSVKIPQLATRHISGKTYVELGGVSLTIFPVGHAHTDGSLVVSLPDDKLIFSGDVLYRGRLLSILPDSNITGWLGAYERLREFNDYVFVPGHGRPGKLQEFEHSTYTYLYSLQQYMNRSVENMQDIQDAINNFDDSTWSHLENYRILARRNAHQAYLQSEQAAFQ